MTAYYSSAAPTREYQLTILETKPLLARLALQIAFARSEFRRDPRGFAVQLNTGSDLQQNRAARGRGHRNRGVAGDRQRACSPWSLSRGCA